MTITIRLDKKFLLAITVLGMFSSSLLFVQPIKAQAVSSLSGQYGCILNRNFGGIPTPTGANANITGSNFMMYLDFTGQTAQMNVSGLTNWGNANNARSSVAITIGTLSAVNGPITNSFTASANFTFQGQNNNIATYNLMSVNGGNTLLVQSGNTGNNDGEPTTGVCNKV